MEVIVAQLKDKLWSSDSKCKESQLLFMMKEWLNGRGIKKNVIFGRDNRIGLFGIATLIRIQRVAVAQTRPMISNDIMWWLHVGYSPPKSI